MNGGITSAKIFRLTSAWCNEAHKILLIGEGQTLTGPKVSGIGPTSFFITSGEMSHSAN
jgi:hypothetical protein